MEVGDVDTVGSYPTSEEHAQRWEQLAREIAASRRHPRQDAAPKGTLIVLGSGIQGLSFVMGAEGYLRMADKVFYCVSDAPTQVWLQTLRPDAYDLYVFYDDTKPRYHTYTQTSEAILHYVRQGLRVVVVYYGHPGIFVLATHRAIAIARREGHYAVMKPGISALDCLCADLGVDPSFPGLQTFEATDVLLRRRRLDTTAHVVLWQVGGIGDGGFRRKGFVNDKFPLLAEYLEGIYGPDHAITHYIAARHTAFEPTIAVHKISRLQDPAVRATFSGFSTFYIPPKDAAPTDPEMAVRIGLIEPGEKPVDQPAIREIAAYGRYELAALEEFERFHVPDDYQFQERTRAAEFLIEMGQNVALQDLYREAPAQAIAGFSGLSAVERQYLERGQEGWALLAARGAVVSASPNERFVIDIHKRHDLASGFRAAVASAIEETRVAASIDSWISSQGYRASLLHLPSANKLVNASMLLPWTGVYATAGGSVVITILGNPDHNHASLVYVGETPITRFTFHDATLSWEDGQLTFRMPAVNGTSAFVRTVSGTVSGTNVVASEVVAATAAQTPATAFEGRYRVWSWSDDDGWQTAEEFHYDGASGNGLQFFVDPATQLPKFAGHLRDRYVCGVLDATVRPRSGDGDVPSRVWETLAAIGTGDCDPSYHLLWSRWQRARFTCRLLNSLIPRVREVSVP